MTTKKVMKAFDGWENLFTGLGVEGKDHRLATTYNSKSLMQEGELSYLYTSNGFARRIVDKYVEAMLQKGFKVEGDDNNDVLARFDELNLWKPLERLLKWNRLHGGALMFLGLDDGVVHEPRDLEKPLNERGLRRILFARVYDRWQVMIHRPIDIYNDPNDPKYGQVKFYNIQPTDGTAPFRVHESRCIVLEGVDVPDRIRQLNQGWGLSFLQHCFEQLRSLGSNYDHIEGIVESFVTQTITMENLMALIVAGKTTAIKRRLEFLDMARSVYKTTLLDKDETFNKVASTVTGLPEILDKFLQALSIVSGIPARILLGQQGGGLNNNGDGETRDWYDSIASEQLRILKPSVLERLVRFVMLEREGKFRGKELPDWFIEFNPLYQMSDKEVAEVRKINAEADVLYVTNQVLDPAEVAISRFGGAKYGRDVQLQTMDRNLNDEGEDDDEAGGGNDKPGGANEVTPL